MELREFLATACDGETRDVLESAVLAAAGGRVTLRHIVSALIGARSTKALLSGHRGYARWIEIAASPATVGSTPEPPGFSVPLEPLLARVLDLRLAWNVGLVGPVLLLAAILAAEDLASAADDVALLRDLRIAGLIPSLLLRDRPEAARTRQIRKGMNSGAT